MGLYNAVSSSLRCAQCGTRSDFHYQFKGYGILGMEGYRLGDKMRWDLPGRMESARDRKLRYVNLAGDHCQSCGAAAPGDILIVRNDVLEEIVTIPEFSAAAVRGARGGLSQFFKPWEVMVLVRTYGPESVGRSYAHAADSHASKDWRKYLETGRNRALALAEKMKRGSIKPSDWESAFEWAAAEDPFPERTIMRTSIINHLAGVTEIAESLDSNLLRHDFDCPGCGKLFRASFPFNYGPMNGTSHAIGSTIDWSSPGAIPQLRDSELRYVPIKGASCESCHHQAEGVVTIEKDVISEVFIWPEPLRRLLLNPPRDLPVQTELDMFLTAREFGATRYFAATEKLYAALEPLTPAERRDAGILGQYEPSTSRLFYDELRAAFKTETGKDYA